MQAHQEVYIRGWVPSSASFELPLRFLYFFHKVNKKIKFYEEFKKKPAKRHQK